MRITDYPDLLRTKGKEPMPQAWDETNQDWTPAIDSAATLKALREALGAPADATQADPVQEATAIALLKGLLELTAMRATELTLGEIKTALTDGTQQVQLTGSLVQQPDAITADTVIAAGADIVLPMRTIASKRIAVGIRLGAARKHQVAMLCYAASDATNYIKEAIVVDNASAVRTLDAAQMDAFTNRLKLRVYNKDTQDMTVKLLSLAEVY